MPYLDLDGLKTWHDVEGDGPPVVLLHPGFNGASAWEKQRPALLDAGFRVHVPERRGHDRTPDVDGPITYEQMATDTIAYLDHELGGPAHLVGWSDGAAVGLLVARQRPDLVDRLVLIGQYYNAAGRTPGGLVEQMAEAGDDAMQWVRRDYDATSPDGPEHFPVVYRKLMAEFATQPELTLDSVAEVQAQTLVLQADRDEATLSHAAAVAEAIPAGRLAILPGSHALPLESPDAVNALLVGFLRGGVPEPAWG